LPRPGAKTDQAIASESLTMINRAESNVLNVLRNLYPDEDSFKVSCLIKALESIHDCRINILTLKNKMRKRDRKIEKYKKIVKSLNGGNIEVSLPSNLFEIDEVQVLK